MKNNFNKIKRKNAGFTLLELVVVVAVMGLISSMAMDVYTDNSNQKRYEATKDRLAEIKFAIIGDPMMRKGSQAVLSGFFNDMNRLPQSLSELISSPATNETCTNSTYTIESTYTDQATCELAGHIWGDWKGPYLNSQNINGNNVFTDAWGNSHLWDNPSSIDLSNFGWNLTFSTSPIKLEITTAGLNHKSTGSGYEEDKSIVIYEKDLDNIATVSAFANPEYCINTATSTVTVHLTTTACTAAGHIWVVFP